MKPGCYFLIERWNGRIFIQAMYNGVRLPRVCYVGFSLEGAIRKYRQDHGLRGRQMDRVYL